MIPFVPRPRSQFVKRSACDLTSGLSFWLRAAGLAALLILCLRVSGAENKAVAQFQTDVQPILHEYCYDCHGDGMNKGKVAFDELKSNDALLDHELWTKVMKNVRAGLMPPQKKSRPTPEDQKRLENWIKYAAFGIDPKNPDPGRVTVRRLNRVEYHNTIHDLTGVDFNASVEFPPDDTGYGFDNIGDVLTVSPMLLEKYMAAATAIVAEAVPTVSKVIPEKTIAGSRFRRAGTNTVDNNRGGNRRDTMLGLSYYEPAAVSTTFRAEQPGTYRLALQLAVKGEFDFDPGKCRVVFKVDGHEELQKEFGWYANETFPLNFELAWQPGEHQMAFELQPLTPVGEKINSLEMRIVSLTVRGPMEEKYWDRPKNYDRFFAREVPRQPAEIRQYAREVLGNFTRQAFRRPADDRTVDRLVAIAEGVYNQPGKTFEAGVAHALVAVLASPRFLFRMEESEPSSSRAAYSLIDEYSLASRLSYFLWSSMPDEELFGLAAHGELRKNLPAQVKRMLADSRSEAMVKNFTGQWLQSRDVEGISIDARVVLARDKGEEKELKRQQEEFRARIAQRSAQQAARQAQTNSAAQTNQLAAQQRPFNRFRPVKPSVELDGELRQAMLRETEMFFSSVVHEDRSITDLIDSDYTFLNEKLARVYGLTNLNVTGAEMRRVTLPPDCPRGGVLTDGSVLVVTSNPDRTSPVKRGLFVLNNILGTPPAPPPPNIPALEAAEKDIKDHEPLLRESLEMHRNSPLCSSCHSRMDPIGLAFENFNALGMWREKERNQAIETGGKLITGETFNSVHELKHLLANERRQDFYRCLTEKMLTYALGRGTEYYDVETTDQIVQRLNQENGRFSALLMGIIESAPFQKQRNQATAAAAAETAETGEPTAPHDQQIAKNKNIP